MWRWMILVFGVCSIGLAVFLNHYRDTHDPDSVAIVIFGEDYNDSAVKMVRIDMMRNQKTIFTHPLYDEKQIQHYTWSPDGRWLMILMRDNTRFTELHLVSYSGTVQRKIYQGDYIFNYPRWSAAGDGIFLAEFVDGTDRADISIKHLDLAGHLVNEYIVQTEPSSLWDFTLLDDDTLWLSDSPSRPTGFFIDTQTGKITENTEYKYPFVYNGVSPNGKWFIEVGSKGIQLRDWYNKRNIQWLIDNETIPLTDALAIGWSDDSQWVALLGSEAPTRQTSSFYGVNNVYIANTAGTEIIQLTDDDRYKTLIMTEPANSIYAPFSPHNHWLLYSDQTDYPPTINAVRTDGSRRSVRNWFADQQLYVINAKWIPPIAQPQPTNWFILGGALLVMGSLGLTTWHIRRQTT